MAAGNPEEDGFREIQLNGKQLVFLFMAATVVLVVTFLTGVLVGRGVRAERVEAAQADTLIDGPAAAEPSAEEPVTPPGDDPRTAVPPSTPEEITEPPVAVPRNPEPAPAPAPVVTQPPATASNNTAPVAKPAAPSASASRSTTTPAPAPASETSAAAKPAAAATAPASSSAAREAVASAPPSGPRNGYAVQVAAVNVRSDAEAIVRRLSGKGYSAYVETPRNNASVFRVRVGTFRTRREAQTVAEKLQREEKFKPWVTR